MINYSLPLINLKKSNILSRKQTPTLKVLISSVDLSKNISHDFQRLI
jgi:hypothetical protein